MTVAIVTDSAASLPDEVAAAKGVSVVPLNLTLGGEPYHDGELPLDELLGRLDEGVTTSGPTPGDFTKAIEAALVDADDVLVLTISANMSSTFAAARLACRAVGEHAVALDTLTAAGAQGLVVLAAADRAAAGGTLAEVEATARGVAQKVRLIATVNRLDRLVASGRVPAIAGLAGRSLNVNPLFEFRQGKVRPLRPAFSRDAALTRILASCSNERPDEDGSLPRRRPPRRRSRGGGPADRRGRARRGRAAGVRRLLQPGDDRPHRPGPGRPGLVVGGAALALGA